MIDNHTVASWLDAIQKVAFPNIGTQTISTYFNNTEVAGELSFAGTTTAQFTLTSTDSVLHPLVVLQCEFNCNGNQPWPTFSGNAPTYTVTVNFPSAVGSSEPLSP